MLADKSLIVIVFRTIVVDDLQRETSSTRHVSLCRSSDLLCLYPYGHYYYERYVESI